MDDLLFIGFDWQKETDDVATLSIARQSYSKGNRDIITIINTISGERAVELYNELTKNNKKPMSLSEHYKHGDFVHAAYSLTGKLKPGDHTTYDCRICGGNVSAYKDMDGNIHAMCHGCGRTMP